MQRAVLWMLLWSVVLGISACAGGGASSETDDDRDTAPIDGDWPWTDGDRPDGDLDTDVIDQEPEAEAQPCDPATDIDRCEGTVRVTCNDRLAVWERVDCAPEICQIFAETTALCVPGVDGDQDIEADADDDGDAEPDADADLDLEPERDADDADMDETDADTDIESDQDESVQQVIHVCSVNFQTLGDPCTGAGFCADFCEPRVGAGCWRCLPDQSCEPAEEGTGSCAAGDPDIDLEEDSDPEWECDESDTWYCVGNLLYYCAGGFWESLDCADNGQTCQAVEGGSQCGGTAIDGDDDSDTDGGVCAVDPDAVGPRLAVDASALLFDNVPQRTLTSAELRLCNVGNQPLRISGVHLHQFSSSWFSVIPPDNGLPIELASGEQVGVNLSVYPLSVGMQTVKLVVAGNDPIDPVRYLDVSASARAEARVTTLPAQILRFPLIPGHHETLRLTNSGNIAVTLDTPYIENAAGDFYLSGADIAGPLNPGGFYDVDVYQSGDERAATLIFPWTCTGCGLRQTTVGLTTSTGNDCPLAALPPDMDAYPMTRVVLDGSGSLNPDGALPEYRWSWIERPDLAVASDFVDDALAVITGLWRSEDRPSVYLDQAGTYRAQLTVRDGGGQSCGGVDGGSLYVRAIPLSALFISLTVAEGGGDHDLHLVRPGATFSAYNPANTGDCYKGNCQTGLNTNADCPARGCPGPSIAPDWGVVGERGDDPMLLTSSTGRGPETLMLDVLETGEYRVVVENVSGGTTTDYSVQIWVNGALELEHAARISAGNCNHEIVAQVAVAENGQVTVTEAGTVVPSGCL